MEDEKEKDEAQVYWFQGQTPTGSVMIATMIIFPFMMMWWIISIVSKKIMIANRNRRHKRQFGRRMNMIEELEYRWYLDRKFMI